MTEVDLPAPGVGPALQRILAQVARRRRALAALWALVVAAGAVAHFATQPAQPLLQVRTDGVSQSIAVLDRGGPPLLASSVPYRSGLPAHDLARLGQGDDAGVYLYLPLLGDLTGQADPAVLMRWLFAGCFGLLMLTLTIVSFELFDSLLVAFALPILLLWQFEGTQGTDIYWVESWCLLLCLPPLLLGLRWWRSGRRRRAGLLLAGLALAAGFASSIRTNSGLAVLVDGLAVVVAGDWVDRWQSVRLPPRVRLDGSMARRLALFGLLVLAYLVPSYLAPAAAAAYRNSVVHTLAPAAALHRPASNIGVLGLLGDALRRYWLAPVLLAVGLAVPRLRREAALAGLFVVPALLVGATALRVVPKAGYALGWAGAWGTLWLLGIGWTAAELTRLRSRPAVGKLIRSLRSRPAASVGAVTLVVAVLAAAGIPSPAKSTDAFYTASETPFVFAPLNVESVASWSFAGSLAAGWHRDTAARIQPDYSPAGEPGLFVKTPAPADAVTLAGPWRRVPAGTYVVKATGDVLGGGVALTTMDEDGAALTSERYWWNEGNRLEQPMVDVVDVPAPTRIRVTVTNWAPAPQISSFVLRRVWLTRLVPPESYYAARATPLVSSGSLHGTTVHAWPFDGGTPQGVDRANPYAQQSSLSGAIGIVTSTEPSEAQLVLEPLDLSPGRYAFTLDGSIEQGGLLLEVLDAHGGATLASGSFWSGHQFDSGEMAAVVTVHAETTVRVVLANWAPQIGSSQWTLKQLALQRLP